MGAVFSDPISKQTLAIATKYMHEFFKNRAESLDLVLYLPSICTDHNFCNHPCIHTSKFANFAFDQDYSKQNALLIVLETSEPVCDLMDAWLNYDNAKFLIIIGYMSISILMHERWEDVYRKPIESPGCMLGCPREIAIFVKR